MLNFDLQLAILKSLVVTYLDERRIEITSKQFATDNQSFTLNLTYLKKEKLIDLSSLNSKAGAIPLINSDEPETVKTLASETITIARCNLTHLGIKSLALNSNVKIIQAN